MRIAIDGRYLQDHFPGIARYTYNLVENLADMVDEEIILYHNPRLTNTRYDAGRFYRKGKIDLRTLNVATFSIWEQLSLPVTLHQDRVQVFHSPYYLKPYFQPGRSVVSIHDLISAVYPEHLPSRRSRALFEIATRLALASAARIITLSESSKKDLVRIFGAKQEKVTVTYLAADARFCPRDREALAPVRERYGLPDRYILYVGINKPHKNLARLIEAFASLRRASAISLVIAGKEDRRHPQARAAAQRSSAADRIIFLEGFSDDDLPYIYNLAEAFVFPSLYEGFGLPPLEAMASGVPVISSNRSSLPEVVGNAALTVDPKDVTAMAEAMSGVLEDERLRDELRSRGIERATAFSWRETARQTLAVYQEAMR